MTPKIYAAAAMPDQLGLFGQMLAQAPFAIWMADRQGKVLLFNEAMKSLVNIDDPDRVLSSYNIFEDPIVKTQGLAPYIKRVLTGQVVQTVVMMDLGQENFSASAKTDPKVFYVRCLYFPIKDDRGEFEYVVQVVENITKDYMGDLEMSRSAHELETANKEIIVHENEIIALKKRVRLLKQQLDEMRKHL